MISSFFSIIFQPLLGYLSDRVGKKKPIVLGGFLVALGPFLLAMANNWVWLIPGTILNALDQSLWTTRQALFSDSIDVEKRGIAFATFFTIFGLTSSFLPAIGGIILDQAGLDMGFRLGLIYQGTARLFQSLLNAKFIREEKKLSEQNVQPASRGDGLRFSSVKRFFADIVEPFRGNKTLQVMIIGQGLASFGMGLVGRFTVVYATDFIGLSKTGWGLISSVSNFINTIVRIPLGAVADKYGRTRCIIISGFIMPIYNILFFHAQTFMQVLILTLFVSIGRSLGGPSRQALMTDVTHTSGRGRLFGTFGSVSNIFRFASPSIGAFLWETNGPIYPFYLAGAVRFSAALLMLARLREPKKREI
jgi:MFS family permease